MYSDADAAVSIVHPSPTVIADDFETASVKYSVGTPAADFLTPSVDPQTPIAGALTPAVDSQTPVAGGLTPTVDPQTPIAGALTPAADALTPAPRTPFTSSSAQKSAEVHELC